MTTVLLILLALGIAAGVVFFLMKSGKIEDKDNNNIPDAIDKKVEQVKEVVADVKQVVAEVKQVAEKVKKPAAKKPAAKKPANKNTKK